MKNTIYSNRQKSAIFLLFSACFSSKSVNLSIFSKNLGNFSSTFL
nr:MAG TPA: hypothetical protein [Caudoviricetes sp.]